MGEQFVHHKDNTVEEYSLCIASVSIGTAFLHQGTATGVSHEFIPLIRSFTTIWCFSFVNLFPSYTANLF